MRQSVGRILEVLYDRDGQFVWLDELAELAGGGRRLSAGLDELAAAGHRLERSSQGVRLARPTVMNAHLVERGLGTRSLGRHVICFGEVDSTSDVCFTAAARAQGAARRESLVVTAEHQRAGRGRLGRSWVSPPGANLLFSVLLDEACDVGPAGSSAQRAVLRAQGPEEEHGHAVANSATPLAVAPGNEPGHEALTIAAGLAVAEGVEAATGVQPAIEWPNDVTVEGAKLAGILVETRSVGRGRRVVIGIGVNVAAAPSGLAGRRAVCLNDLAGRAVERIELLRAILQAVDRWLWALRAGQVEELHQSWLARCGMINRRITVQHRRPEGAISLTGRVIDIDPLAGLTLELDSLQRVHLHGAVCSVEKD